MKVELYYGWRNCQLDRIAVLENGNIIYFGKQSVCTYWFDTLAGKNKHQNSIHVWVGKEMVQPLPENMKLFLTIDIESVESLKQKLEEDDRIRLQHVEIDV